MLLLNFAVGGKLMGATVSNISASLGLDFLQPVLVSFLLATPMAAWAMQKMLLSMEYHVKLSWWMYALAGSITVLVALLAVSFQSIKAAFMDPAKNLRTE